MLIRIAFFSALGGFLFGYDLGLIGGALLGFTADLDIRSSLVQASAGVSSVRQAAVVLQAMQHEETIVGALKFGAFFGTFIGGALMLRYGRRLGIAATSIAGLLGPVLMATSFNSVGLILGRVVSGLGIGASAIIAPAYLAELAPAQHRGAMVQVYEVMLCIGMFISTVVDWALQHAGPHGWRWMVGLPAIPGAAIGLALLILPESPRWLVMQGRLDEALLTLQQIMRGSELLSRGALLLGSRSVPKVSPERLLAEAEDELLLLWSSVEKDKAAVMHRRAELAASRQARRQQRRAAREQASASSGSLRHADSSAADLAAQQQQPQQQPAMRGAQDQGKEPLLAQWAGEPSDGATAGGEGAGASTAYVSLSQLMGNGHHHHAAGHGGDGHGAPPPHGGAQPHEQQGQGGSRQAAVEEQREALGHQRLLGGAPHDSSSSGGAAGAAAWGAAAAPPPSLVVVTPGAHVSTSPVVAAPTSAFTLGDEEEEEDAQAGQRGGHGGGNPWQQQQHGSGGAGGRGVAEAREGSPLARYTEEEAAASEGLRFGRLSPGDAEQTQPTGGTSSSPFHPSNGGAAAAFGPQAFPAAAAAGDAGADAYHLRADSAAHEQAPIMTLRSLPGGSGAHLGTHQDPAGSAGLLAAQPRRSGGGGGGSGSGGVGADGGAGAGNGLLPSSGSSWVAPRGQDELEPGRERNFYRTLVAMLWDIRAVLKGPERRACIVAMVLAVFNQATASTAIINYAPTLLRRVGSLSDGGAMAYTIAIALTKVIGVCIGLVTVDTLGRRPLLIWGALGCAFSMALATGSAAAGAAPALLLCMCLFILAFSVSWAGVYWVVVSEVFSMAAKSPASSAATSLLFLSGAVTNMVFLVLVDGLGAGTFLVFAGVALASGLYVYTQLPETKGRTLAEVQDLMSRGPTGILSWGGGGTAKPPQAATPLPT